MFGSMKLESKTYPSLFTKIYNNPKYPIEIQQNLFTFTEFVPLYKTTIVDGVCSSSYSQTNLIFPLFKAIKSMFTQMIKTTQQSSNLVNKFFLSKHNIAMDNINYNNKSKQLINKSLGLRDFSLVSMLQFTSVCVIQEIELKQKEQYFSFNNTKLNDTLLMDKNKLDDQENINKIDKKRKKRKRRKQHKKSNDNFGQLPNECQQQQPPPPKQQQKQPIQNIAVITPNVKSSQILINNNITRMDNKNINDKKLKNKLKRKSKKKQNNKKLKENEENDNCKFSMTNDCVMTTKISLSSPICCNCKNLNKNNSYYNNSNCKNKKNKKKKHSKIICMPCKNINQFPPIVKRPTRQISECSDDSLIICFTEDFKNDDNGKEYQWMYNNIDSQSDSDSGLILEDEKKVRFNLIPEIHEMKVWNFAYRQARKGHWEEMARDRVRFSERIQRTEKILSPYLQEEHRHKIFSNRFLDNTLQ